jgi:hypothetical protein
MQYENDLILHKIQREQQRIDHLKHSQQQERHRKKQLIFAAEQKRSDMRTAFYHMSVWNVNDTAAVVDKLQTEKSPFSVGEQIRHVASELKLKQRHELGQTISYMSSQKDKLHSQMSSHPAAAHYGTHLAQTQKNVLLNVKAQPRPLHSS